MKANVILIRCNKYERLFGTRVQQMEDGDWYRTWAFKIDSKHAQNEGYDTNQVIGNLNATDEYPGCPYCGSMTFVQCGNCGNLTCWNGETSLYCNWCNSMMENIIPATNKFSISGTNF